MRMPRSTFAVEFQRARAGTCVVAHYNQFPETPKDTAGRQRRLTPILRSHRDDCFKDEVEDIFVNDIISAKRKSLIIIRVQCYKV